MSQNIQVNRTRHIECTSVNRPANTYLRQLVDTRCSTEDRPGAMDNRDRERERERERGGGEGKSVLSAQSGPKCIDLNGMPRHKGLFYAQGLKNSVHCTFIFIFSVVVLFYTQLYGIKYFYLIQIICTELYDFTKPYLILIIDTQIYDFKKLLLFDNNYLFAHSYMVLYN